MQVELNERAWGTPTSFELGRSYAALMASLSHREMDVHVMSCL